jgi:hypothetical protein
MPRRFFSFAGRPRSRYNQGRTPRQRSCVPEASTSDPTPTPRTDAGDLAEEWRRRWTAGGAPDLGAFLAQVGPLPPGALAAVLRVDQRQRWETGQRVPSEDYLRRYPQLHADPEAVLDLIFHEFLLRQERGEQDADAVTVVVLQGRLRPR